jgi:hypothetical protein
LCCCSGIVACFVSTFQPRGKKKRDTHTHTSQIGWSDHQQNKPAAYHHRLYPTTYSILMAIIIFFLPFFFSFFFFWDWVFDFADCYRNWPMECRPFSSLFWGCLLLLGHTE